MNVKAAATDHPLLKLLSEQWNPFGFKDRPVRDSKLRAIVCDLNLATANLVMEAASRSLRYQAIRGLQDQVCESFQIPEHFEAWTAYTIGHKANPADMSDKRKLCCLAQQQRKLLDEFAFLIPPLSCPVGAPKRGRTTPLPQLVGGSLRADVPPKEFFINH